MIAHSDPSRNGIVLRPEQGLPIPVTGEPLVSERHLDGRSVKEVVIPYRGGLDGRILGSIRIGLNVESARQAQRFNLVRVLVLTTLLTAGAIWMVLLLSRRFGGAVRALAVQLQGIADSLPGVIYRFHLMADGSVRMVFASQAAMHLFGLESSRPEDFLAVFTAGLDPEDRERFHASVRAAATAGSPWDFSARFTRADGLKVWFHCIAQVAPFADGASEFSGVLLDVTQRKQAEESLQEKQEMINAIVETSRDWIWRSTPAAFILFNPASRQILGREPDEVIGRDNQDLLHEEDRALIQERLPEWIRERRGWNNLLLRWRHKDGSYRYLESNAVPIMDAAGMLPGFRGVDRDVTERKQAEEERERLQIQLVQAQKIESVGRWRGRVAHDFNNMRSVILGHTELALEDLEPGQPLYLELQEVRKAAERSAALTRQLLAFARKQTVAPKVLALNETVEGMLRMLRRLIGEDIDLAWRPGEDLPPVKMDPSQIDQILANLCVNARDAIDHSAGKVTIETGRAEFDRSECAARMDCVPGVYVLMAVSDNGRGMSEEIQAHVFEPFFTTKTLGEGTGLGLATVYGIVGQNRGFINVYSEVGRGTTFRIYLPACSEEVLDATGEKQAEVSEGHETVLLVEDEPSILSLATQMLERLGYRTLAASTPGEALRLAREHAGEIHLLITDVVMPGMNGSELARQLLAFHPRLKSLFMSGYTANVIAHQGVIEKGVNFMQKPFSFRELSAKVRQALEG